MFLNKTVIFVSFIRSIGIMDDKELNAYRLTSLEEPTDEMLSQIMKEVAEEARQKSEEAHRRYFAALDENSLDTGFGTEAGAAVKLIAEGR